jgi:hypothetical protein
MSLKKKLQSGNMAQKKKKPVAQRSRRSGVKKAELVKSNQQVLKRYGK